MTRDGTQQVRVFLEKLEHPMKDEILEARRVILAADDRLTEHIKWNAPSYCIGGDDRITFHLHGNGRFRLILHRGAKKKEVPARRLLEDDTGLLEWAENDRAVITFRQGNMPGDWQDKLSRAVARWIEATDR